MTIASEITRLQTAKSDIKTAIESKGVSVPISAKLDTYDDYINAIVQGGGDYDKESIVYIMQADSNGYLYVPVGGYNGTSSSLTANCPYNWKVSVDGGPETTISGTGSSGGKVTLSGYTANYYHTITIKPVTEIYGWARAYSWASVNVRTLLTAVLYDGSYKGYASSATSTGYHFKCNQYNACTNLRSIPANMESMPDTVTTIGDNFMNGRFYGCTSLALPSNEKLSKNVTSIGNSFRFQQYYGCTLISYSPEEDIPNYVSVGQQFRRGQYSGTQVALIKGIKEPTSYNSNYFRYDQFNNTQYKYVKVLTGTMVGWYNANGITDYYTREVKVPSVYLTAFKNSSTNPRVNITDSKFVGY